MHEEAVNSLIATAQNESSTDEEMTAAAQKFLDVVQTGTRENAEAALQELGKGFDTKNSRRGALVAVLCGVLIEQGCSPSAVADSLTKHLEYLLRSAADLAMKCAKDIDVDDDEIDPAEMFESKRMELAPSMPRQNDAWEALSLFWRPAIAVYSRSTSARQAAKPLRELALSISEYHEAGHWLQLMLDVLDDESFIAIEPETKLGIRGRMSGIVDNFQLNILLMDGLPELTSQPRVSQAVVDIAKGKGAQFSDDVVSSIWNLYTWEAIQDDSCLPNSDDIDANAYWIWNEGSPADIPVFEGHRVILLGPHSYPRSWQSQRMFEALPAELSIEQILSESEVSEWLSKMARQRNAG